MSHFHHRASLKIEAVELVGNLTIALRSTHMKMFAHLSFSEGGNASKENKSAGNKHQTDNENGERRARKRTQRKPWSTEEKMAVARNFGHCFKNCSLPGKKDIESVLLSEHVLQNRTWTNIKDFVRHQMGKRDPLDFV